MIVVAPWFEGASEARVDIARARGLLLVKGQQWLLAWGDEGNG